MAAVTYKNAGVDIDAGERLVDRIRSIAAGTAIPEALGQLGGFAALCRVPADMQDPVLVSGTDGVGTKLKIAFATDRHDTVGIDLVAMCVNDIITTGARPLFFLDYFATGKLDVERGAAVVSGIAQGCKQAGCGLLGGETAEMPGMYAENEYDLAGFAVGVVERGAILTGETIRAGDAVLGVASSGLHANGFSLARKVLIEGAGLELPAVVDDLGQPLGEVLLHPTRIYAKAVRSAMAAGEIHGLCHITGGGLVGNIPRILPQGLYVELRSDSWHCPAIFKLIARLGGIEGDEMRRVFNMGIGFVLIAERSSVGRVLSALHESGETAWQIGVVQERPDSSCEPQVRFV